MAISSEEFRSLVNKTTKRLCVVVFQIKLESALRHEDWETEELKIRTTINTQACNDNFLCLSFSQVKWKMAVKNFVFVNENQFTWRSGQNYTLRYYQLTFSEPKRLIVSVICASSDKSNFSNYKTVKNPSSMKQNNWTTSCTQNEAKRAWETLIWLESVTEKVTGLAQTGACVVPQTIRPWAVSFFTENSSVVPRPVRPIRVTRECLEPTSMTGDVTSEIAEDGWKRGWENS